MIDKKDPHVKWQKDKLKVKNQEVIDDGTQSFFW
jgi:hypothetical protein